MTWIQTRHGRAIDLLNPDPDTIHLEDLAFALARINRFTGHAAYSVGTHSLRVAKVLEDAGHPAEIVRYGLLHDAHEAIVGDVASPVKRALRQIHRDLGHMTPDPWTVLEETARRAVCKRFGLSPTVPEAVQEADLRMLVTERIEYLGEEAKPWGIKADPYLHPPRLNAIFPSEAEAMFLIEARRLGCV